MGPLRTGKIGLEKGSHHGPRKTKRAAEGSDESLPGVQKIKAAIRQTRRLLAKDKLAADVRVASERRLKSLESDLEVAERRKKERLYAVKYHKVKFFEKKKVLRRIKHVKTELDSQKSSKQPATDLENQLFELRVDLNYILHYPKLEKYISLFPVKHDGNDDHTSSSPLQEADATTIRRQEIRSMIRERMEAGELSGEPEEELNQAGGEKEKSRVVHSSKSTTKPSGPSGSRYEGNGREGLDKRRRQKVKESSGDKFEKDEFFEFEGDSG